jgi:KaiC/GvpD/RAD55 family RecA-like ATPase
MSAEEKQDYFVIDQPAMLAIIGHCLSDLQFLRNCAKNLTKSHIEHPILADLYDYISGYYKQFECAPTVNEVESHLFAKYPDKISYDKYRLALHESVAKRENFSKKMLTTRISGWLKLITMKKGLVQTAHLFNGNKYDQAERELSQLAVKLREAKFEEETRANLSNIRDRLDKLALQKGEACTLGNAEFDNAVLEGSKLTGPTVSLSDLKTQTSGCLLPGEITMVLGPSNSGKTTALATIVVSNIAIGKKVCIVSHEESEDKMAIKLFQSFTELTGEEMSYYNSSKFENAEKTWKHLAEKNLFTYEWIKPGRMFCEDVIDMISNEHEKQVVETGKGFDLVLVDYPAKTKSRDYGKNKNDWDEKEYVYEQYRLLARKYQFHCITPVQTNREGFRANKDGAQMLDMDNAASGFGIMTLADIVISINRSYNDVSLFVVKFFIAKSRQGPNKKTFISETRYDLGRTHGVGYGCFVAPPVDANKIDDNYITHHLSATGRPKTKALIDRLAERNANLILENIPSAKGSVPIQEISLKQNLQSAKNLAEIKVDSKGNPIT